MPRATDIPFAELCARIDAEDRRRRGHGNQATRACPDDARIRDAVSELLGTPRPEAVCRLVNPAEMKKALDEHDWPANTDPNTFYGFHTDNKEILVAETAPWSTLHEVFHDGGVDDRDVARWLCEALAEEGSEYLAKRDGFAWKPTYPAQRALIQREILPRLKLGTHGGVKLARLVAQGGVGKSRPDRRIARALARGRLRGRRRQIERALNTAAGDNMDLFLEAIA
jgi:hypothetical protein